MNKISIKTRNRVEFIDITTKIQELIDSENVQNGICYIFVPHTTAGLTLNEHADPSVVEDIARQFEKVAPQNANYQHTEGNSPGHIKASLVNSHEVIFVESGSLVLGRWQGIFFCEFDGPRSRNILVKFIPE